jgi:hypothetical protein
MSREAALAFLESDTNGDGVLDWQEFLGAVAKMRKHEGCSAAMKGESEKELRELFDSIDTDGSGSIEMDEYFLWTLDVASAHGTGLEVIFRRYDSNGEGTLDVDEFSRAVEDLGFDTGFAHNLFVELDDDVRRRVAACQSLPASRCLPVAACQSLPASRCLPACDAPRVSTGLGRRLLQRVDRRAALTAQPRH